MTHTSYPLATHPIHLEFSAEEQRLRLAQFGLPAHPWLHPAQSSRLFAVTVNGRRYDAANLDFLGLTSHQPAQGVTRHTLRFKSRLFTLEQHIQLYDGLALVETWPAITALKPCRVSRMDAFSIDLQADNLQLHYYSSAWGAEFEPHSLPCEKRITLQTRRGRASNGMHPWFELVSADGQVLAGSVAWSGNWVLRFQPVAGGLLRLSGGMHNWAFEKTLQPGERLESPPGILALSEDPNEAARQFAQAGRRYWYPRNAFSEQLPVEWNHWWSYEDAAIDEDVFAKNIEAAAALGVEVCTLDAGWFGPSDAGTHWYDYRGDWGMVNARRFPHGIRPLAELAHVRGMRFGLWCEIEGLGIRARLAQEHPEYVALRQDQRLGYVCFGSPAVQEWAFQTLSRLIQEHGSDWIKLDFNLDPGAGCDRSDHGHQAGDGLYEHYRGYYAVLERLRRAYPEVILENCSSGGLRIDLGMLRQTHMTFLSDPDWPVHDLQLFWGASSLLAPQACLHWSYSDWCMPNPPPQQRFNPHDPALTRRRLDYYTRISMLGLFGFSQKLPDLPEWVFRRLGEHTRVYKEHVRRFVREGSLQRLTAQPHRSGAGERWSAFQYSLPEEDTHLLFVFRLPGSEPARSIRLRGLQPEREYAVAELEGEFSARLSGRELMQVGLNIEQLEEEDSLLARVA